MIALAALVVWVGYGNASWGWCLVKGYDVPFTQWWNPLDPYTWPADGNPGFVRKGQIFPGGAAGTASATTSTGSSSSAKSTGSPAKGQPQGPLGGRGAVLGGPPP